MDCNKSCSVDRSNGQAATESGDQNPMAQCSTKGLTMNCNAFDRRDLWSTAISNIYIYCSSLCPSVGRYQQTVRPQRDQDGQPTKRFHHQSYHYQSGHRNQRAHHCLPKHGRHCHTHKFCNGLKHHTLSGCIIPFLFLYPRYANLYYTLLLKDYSSSGCVEIPT